MADLIGWSAGRSNRAVLDAARGRGAVPAASPGHPSTYLYRLAFLPPLPQEPSATPSFGEDEQKHLDPPILLD